MILLLIHVPLNLYGSFLPLHLRFQVLCNCALNTGICFLGAFPPLFLLCSSLFDISYWFTDDFSLSIFIHVLIIDLWVLTEHICPLIKGLLVAKGIPSMSNSWWFRAHFLAWWILFRAEVLLAFGISGLNINWIVSLLHIRVFTLKIIEIRLEIC